MARSVHRQRPNKSVDRVVNMASSEKDDTVSPTRSLFTPVLLGTSFVFAPDAAPLIIRTTRIAPEILPFAPTYEKTIRLKKKEKKKKAPTIRKSSLSFSANIPFEGERGLVP